MECAKIWSFKICLKQWYQNYNELLNSLGKLPPLFKIVWFVFFPTGIVSCNSNLTHSNRYFILQRMKKNGFKLFGV